MVDGCCLALLLQMCTEIKFDDDDDDDAAVAAATTIRVSVAQYYSAELLVPSECVSHCAMISAVVVVVVGMSSRPSWNRTSGPRWLHCPSHFRGRSLPEH